MQQLRHPLAGRPGLLLHVRASRETPVVLLAAADLDAPLVMAAAPIAVEVTVDGGSWPGDALGWRGSRVYLQWSTGVGELYLGWLPATQVSGRDQARTWSRYRLRFDRQNRPVPGTRTVVVRRRHDLRPQTAGGQALVA